MSDPVPAFEWKVVGACVCGFSHDDKGIPCQDAYAVRTRGPWVIVSVSDGAGSSAHSEIGSKILADTIAERLQAFVGGLDAQTSAIDVDAARSVLIETIESVRAALVERGQVEGHALKDFSATLVGFIARSDGGVIFHIGDGTAVATRSGEWANYVMSPPENGEYANETYFFTSEDWRERLRLTAVPAGFDLFVAMSDGCMPFALAKGNKGLFGPFIGPLSDYFKPASAEEGGQILEGTLKRDELRKITGDDKTLVWASWQRVHAAAS